MKRIIFAVLAASVTLAAAPAAFADVLSRDVNTIERDRAHLRSDYSTLNRESQAFWRDRARANYDARTGNYFGAWINRLKAGHEAREIRGEDRRIAGDQHRLYDARVKLNKDVNRFW